MERAQDKPKVLRSRDDEEFYVPRLREAGGVYGLWGKLLSGSDTTT